MQGDQIQAYHSTQELFRSASEFHDLWMTGSEGEEIQFEIPILPDMYGITPLDICLGINKHRAADKKIFWRASDSIVEQSENVAMAEVIFSNIKNYGIMHSSALINEAIIKARASKILFNHIWTSSLEFTLWLRFPLISGWAGFEWFKLQSEL